MGGAAVAVPTGTWKQDSMCVKSRPACSSHRSTPAQHLLNTCRETPGAHVQGRCVPMAALAYSCRIVWHACWTCCRMDTLQLWAPQLSMHSLCSQTSHRMILTRAGMTPPAHMLPHTFWTFIWACALCRLRAECITLQSISHSLSSLPAPPSPTHPHLGCRVWPCEPAGPSTGWTTRSWGCRHSTGPAGPSSARSRPQHHTEGAAALGWAAAGPATPWPVQPF